MKSQNIIFVSGVFNVLHPGHFRLLNYASSLYGKLYVGVLSDRLINHFNPVDENERLKNLKSLKFIDKCFLIKNSIEETIFKIKPNIIVKGEEFKNKENIEETILKKLGGQIIFSSGGSSFSDFNFNSSVDDKNYLVFKNPSDFINRRKISLDKIKKVILSFKNLNVCVLGDLILDEYINCFPIGMSQEDPTIVVRPEKKVKYIGGAGIVACHAKTLGSEVSFFSVTGNDKSNIFFKNDLKKNGISANIFEDHSRSSTIKSRYRANDKNLLRLNQFQDHDISFELQNQIIKKIKKLLKKVDIMIFSDFNYGFLTKEMISEIITLAKENNIFISADSQTSSQIGDLLKYKGVSLVTPTEHEARLAIKDNTSGLAALSENLGKKLDVNNIIITLSKNGAFVSQISEELKFQSDQIPSLQNIPVDPAGAGDAFLVASTLALSLKTVNIWEAAFIGSIAAAIQVSRQGNLPIKNEEMLNAISF